MARRALRCRAIADHVVGGPGGPLRLRTYVPYGRAPFPVVVFFHRGGFLSGTVEEFDSFCSRVAAGAEALVVSVDYRLAPEHRFPAAGHDATAAGRWLGANAARIGGDPTRMAVAGDSAGGNLAAIAAIAARDEHGPGFVQQVLICPWVDRSSTASPSFRSFGDGLWLPAASISWYAAHYLASPAHAAAPLASPLLAGTCSGLPPALVIAAEFDVLRDQGAGPAAGSRGRYARRLPPVPRHAPRLRDGPRAVRSGGRSNRGHLFGSP